MNRSQVWNIEFYQGLLENLDVDLPHDQLIAVRKGGGEGRSAGRERAMDQEAKCANCGAIQSFTRDREGKWQPAMTCKACGSRIFIKLRRTGHIILDAE